MKTIDIVVPAYNEQPNIRPLYLAVKEQFEQKMPNYLFTMTFIDNCSEDGTRTEIEKLCLEDRRVRAIFNARNFGHIRSPYYALRQSDGDCAVLMAADFQDPPEKLTELVGKWEQGYKVIYAVKKRSRERGIMRAMRALYYKIMQGTGEITQIKQFTGFGLYDASFIKVLCSVDDPYPYMRGLVSELGFKMCEVEFIQPRRKAGTTKNNFYTLFDMAMLGVTTYTKKLMRLSVMFAALLCFLGVAGGIAAVVARICGAIVPPYYYMFAGLFFALGITLFFVGILAEYAMAANQRLLRRPLVVEESRLNFPKEQSTKDSLQEDKQASSGIKRDENTDIEQQQ